MSMPERLDNFEFLVLNFELGGSSTPLRTGLRLTIADWVSLQESADVRSIIPQPVVVKAGLGIIATAGKHIRIVYVAGVSWLVARAFYCRLAKHIIGIKPL